ncbi:MBL fold metallo-hydrolase [Thalassobacillus pellis]|uniref:MBL fold metallo-hydrolase n=1 Tax=Thalassobacillus pellis TaxID=748008 RepID=UPI00195FA8BB|nr:MBL fold metallo-hydrolase [Thalassobacillus pellis]MBM7554107.1 ribonuclease BN (tRNA processing enzyme) [Thalassobacillus pellis]
MKWTVIGYWGAYPASGSATSCYLLEKDGFRLLIDCGSGALSRLQETIDLMSLDAVILSHYHHDHKADIGALQYAWLVQNTLNNTERILPIYGHGFDSDNFAALSHHFTEGIAYDPSKSLTLGPFDIQFHKTQHPVPCYGMKIADGNASIVYTADTAFSEDWIPFAKNADLLITDTNFYKGMDGRGPGHMTSEEAGILASKAGVGQLYLSHLPHFGDHKELAKQASEVYRGPIELARENLKWTKDR